MGFLTNLFGSPRGAELAMTRTAPVLQLPVSPWADSSHLSRMVLGDIFGRRLGGWGRSDAMAIPPVARGRGLVCGTLSRYPLTLWEPNPDDPSGDTDKQLPTPSWCTSTATDQSPITRMLWTLDDLIFYGLAVWATERNEANEITDAVRIPRKDGNTPGWELDTQTLQILVYGEVAQEDQVIVFEAPQEGLLTLSGRAIEASNNLATAWMQRVQSPIPLVSLEETTDNNELTDDEIKAHIADWEAARKAGGTAFIPFGIKASVMGDVVVDLYTSARNAERLDWANFIGLPAAMLDGSMSTATLTYSTAEGKRSEFVDYSLNYWASAVEARLSLDDVSPEGTYVRFNLKWLTSPIQPATNPGSED